VCFVSVEQPQKIVMPLPSMFVRPPGRRMVLVARSAASKETKRLVLRQEVWV
jgi:hypothetical protein